MRKRFDPTALMNKAIKNLHPKTPSYPKFAIGDTIRVHVKVIEGEKTRIQVYEGIVLAMRRGGINSTFVVRKVSYGIGVERVFPFHSPVIDKIVVVSKGEVRRAKLYYLRGLSGRASRIKSEQVFGAAAEGETRGAENEAPAIIAKAAEA